MDRSQPRRESPSDSDLDRVVLELRSIEHRSSWDKVLGVGRVVFEGVLDGNEAEWRSRRRQKTVSLRRLVQRPGCPFKKSAISTAIGVHLFVKGSPAVLRMNGMSPTHVAQTLRLPPDEALDVLRMASEHDWSVRDLSHHVRALRKAAGERRGRPVSTAEEKARIFAKRAIAALHDAWDQLAGCSCVSEDSRRALRSSLDEMSELVADLHRLPALVRNSSLFLASPASAAHGLKEPDAAAV